MHLQADLRADSGEVAQAFRDDVARYSDMQGQDPEQVVSNLSHVVAIRTGHGKKK